MGKKLYVMFAEREPAGKTKRYDVLSVRGASLGQVKWYSSWRKYCFFPSAGIVFDSLCLQDIIDFLDDSNKAHKESIRSGHGKEDR